MSAPHNEELRSTIDRLVARHADVSREEIVDVVVRHHRRFTAAKVRAFVPILVGRCAEAELRARPPTPSRG